jgi:Txe/YoeB family toxin of toxin-antitoxin system
VSWQLVYSQQATRDARQLAAAGLKRQAQDLLDLLAADPFGRAPPFEKLVGDLATAYSRRISFRHRLVYEISVEQQTVRVLRMWTYFEPTHPPAS